MHLKFILYKYLGCNLEKGEHNMFLIVTKVVKDMIVLALTFTKTKIDKIFDLISKLKVKFDAGINIEIKKEESKED